ncbi:MAG: hypothetical protein H6703_15780 [Myxococcales bacterium]|nr:hypothetical protein [Myxococcales bacterium]
MDGFERVVAWAGAGAQVMRADVDGIAGVALFRVVRRPAGASAPGRGEGVALVGGEVLSGAAAMRAVAPKAGAEADRLARLALVLLEPRSGTVEPGARVEGEAVVFDWRVGEGPGRALMRGRLDRGSWALASTPAAAEVDAVAEAVAALSGASDMTRQAAVATLAARCDDPRAGAALLAAQGRGRWRRGRRRRRRWGGVRRWGGRGGGAAGADAAAVRAGAAAALGRWGRGGGGGAAGRRRRGRRTWGEAGDRAGGEADHGREVIGAEVWLERR